MGFFKSGNPMGLAVWAMVVFAAIFEPVRQILLYGQSTIQVGGVGGVGGLANLGAPTEECYHRYRDAYCFVNGDVGPFMWFAFLTLVFWVGPLVVASLAIACTSPQNRLPRTVTDDDDDDDDDETPSPPPQPQKDGEFVWLLPLWIGLNILWFVLPWTVFALGLKDVEGSFFTRQVLAISLGASHPLSWNLSLVVIPTGGILSEFLIANKQHQPSNSSTRRDSVPDSLKSFWFPSHRLLGYATAFWAIVHGAGELLWLLSSKERFLKRLVRIGSNGEDLLYWAGLLTFALLLLHSYIAYFRHRLFSNGGNNNTRSGVSFQVLHRFLAAALLLAASVHWWPFALLFVPATAVHGVNLARCHSSFVPPRAILGRSSSSSSSSSLLVSRSCSKQFLALQFAVALTASLCGLTIVWSLRQDYMQKSSANLYVPFVYPPLSVIASTTSAYLVSRLTMLVVSFELKFSSDEGEAAVAVNEGRDISTDDDDDEIQTPLLTHDGVPEETI